VDRSPLSGRARATASRRALPSDTVVRVSTSLKLTIVFEPGDDGWVVASVPEVPGAHSQGRTRDEARANVIDALRGILELRFGDHGSIEPGVDHESLDLVIAA
jgi:predicted RNase H-like HicB family nuclease